MFLRRVSAFFAFLLAGLRVLSAGVPGEGPVSEFVFAPERKHNHASCLVEQPDGSWFVAWFRGSGERQADDVGILGSRLARRGRAWEKPFAVSDTEGFPDCNPSLAVAPDGRLWLFHPTILANTWESALLRVKVAREWRRAVPRWERDEVLVLRPGKEFDDAMSAHLPRLHELLGRSDLKADERREAAEFLEAAQGHITNRLYRRLGWMPRAHPVFAADRWFLPLYHDGFSVSLVALSDDHGATWRPSAPIVGAGNVQPCLTRRRDGTIVAWMRDNGPPPKRLLVSESRDRGETWTPAADSAIPNPGSGAEVVVLRDGTWLFIGNDTEEGRHSMAVWMSDDEGRTWPWRRNVARAEEGMGSFGYPSVVEARDGSVHATWSESAGGLETIRHTRFTRDWLRR